MRGRRSFLPVAVVLLVSATVYLTSDLWLPAVGNALVSSDSPGKADAVLVLAGDSRGQRILTACDLVRHGVAPVALVSGPMEQYGVNEADLAIRFAVSRGCQESWFRPVYSRALSTTQEAAAVAPQLDQLRIRTLIIVTSNYHTRRSRAVFKRQLGDRIAILMVAAPDRYFSPDAWWHNREGQKTVFFEVSKTIAWWVGLG